MINFCFKKVASSTNQVIYEKKGRPSVVRALCVLSLVLKVDSLWSLWILIRQHVSPHLRARRLEPHCQCSSISLLFIWAWTHGLRITVRKTRSHNQLPRSAGFPEQHTQTPLLGQLVTNRHAHHLHWQLCFSSHLSLIDWPYRPLRPPSHKSESCQLFFFLLLHMWSVLKSGNF